MTSASYQRLFERIAWRLSSLWRPKRPTVRKLRYFGQTLEVFANEDIGWRLLMFGAFERLELRRLRQLIRTEDICVDVGANIGVYSVLMGVWAPNGWVHAFEPNSAAAKLLASNLTLNEIHRVTIHSCAIGHKQGPTFFSESTDSAFSSLRATGRRPAGVLRENVPCETLDSMFAGQHIDLLKVDVEGAEMDVLRGGTSLFADARRRPRVVLIEACLENLQTYGATVAELVDFLIPLDYEVSTISSTRVQPGVHMVEPSVNLLFVSRQNLRPGT